MFLKLHDNRGCTVTIFWIIRYLIFNSMELASANREPSLFAVAKLLETALVNLDRIDVVWRPITNHLLVVCQHPHLRMRQVS